MATHPETDKSATSMAVLVVAFGALALGIAVLLSMPDRRSATDRLSAATEELADGVQDAGRAMERRTPAERIGDAAREAGEELRETAP